MLVEIADSDIDWIEPRDLSFDHAIAGVNVDRQHGISSYHGNWAFSCLLTVLFDLSPTKRLPKRLRQV